MPSLNIPDLESMIEPLASRPGVLAVLGMPSGNLHPPTVFSCTEGDQAAEQLRPLMTNAALLAAHTPEPVLRVNFGPLTIHVHRHDRRAGDLDGGVVVAVCIPTGHPFCKSLLRTIRRAVKRGE